MKTRRITDLPRAENLNVADETPVAFAYEERGQLYYTTVGEIRRKPANTYTHRNGETEAPTEDGFIGTGRYWFKGEMTSGDCGTYQIVGIVECYLAHVYNDETGETLPKSACVGQWWGPIVPPWQSED